MKNFLSDCKTHETTKSHMGAYKTGSRVDFLVSQTSQGEIQRRNEGVK